MLLTANITAESQYAEDYCQLFSLLFAIIACSLALCGCTKQEAPDYNRLRTQLLCDAADALAAGNSQQAQTLLKRYRDAVPESSFARMALAREEQRHALEELNAALSSGDYRAVQKVFKQAADNGPVYEALAGFEALPPALAALQDYLDRRPFAESKKMRQAWQRLEPHLPILERSDAFRAFRLREQARLRALEARETAIVVRRLVDELDAAAVSGGLPAGLLLAHLGALAPKHPAYRAARCVLEGDWTSFRDMTLQALDKGTDFAPLEIACCLYWPALSERERNIVGKLFSRGAPESLSGFALYTWQAAVEGQFATAVRRARILTRAVCPKPALIDLFLTRCILPAPQFNAWCWRSPAPGVIDFLGRIEQLREYAPLPHKR